MNRGCTGWGLGLLTAASLLLPSPSHAQGEPQANPPAETVLPREHESWYSLRQWSVRAGLPQVSATALLRNHCGALWVGTEAGPSRFDGEDFETPEYHLLPHVPVDTCIDLAAFRYRKVAALSRSGTVLLLSVTDIDDIEVPPELTEFNRSLQIRHIARYGPEALALGTRRGLFVWRYGEAPAPVPGFEGERILGLERGRDNSLWVGTPSRTARVTKDGETRPVPGVPTALCVADTKTGTWIGTSEGLYRFDTDGNLLETPDDGLPAFRCRDLDILANGDVALIDGAEQAWILKSGSAAAPRYKVVGRSRALCVEASNTDGAFWFGTLTRGLNRLAERPMRRRFANANVAVNLSMTSVYAARDGTVWAGTDGHGLLRASATEDRVLEPVAGAASDSMVLSFHEPGDGTLLVGHTDGLSRWDGSALRPVETPGTGPLKWVRAMTTTPSGELLVSAASGVFRFTEDRWQALPSPGEDAPPELWCFYHDGAELFAGARNGGLFSIEDGVVTRVPLGPDHDEITISAICRVGDTLWLGALGGRIYRLEDGTCREFDLGADYLTINILGMRSFGDELLWISCTRGVLALDTSAEAIANPLRRCMPSTAAGYVFELNGHSGNAIAAAANGERLFAPGQGGLLEVDTDAFMEPPGLGEPFVHDPLIDGRLPTVEDGAIVLSPGDREIRIVYQHGVLGSTEPVLHRHRLLGFTDEWATPRHRTPAVFTDLPPGEYTFECQLGTPAGWSGDVRRFGVRVLPSFTERRDVRIAALVLGILLLLLGVHLFSRQQLIRNQALESVVAERTEALAEEVRLKEEAESALRRSNEELDLKIQRRTSELEATHNQLVQAQKLESVARLAGGLAHDLNNLLTAIMGFAETAGEDIPLDSPGRQDMAEIRRAGERAAALVNQLLTFARPQPTQPRILDLSALLDQLEPMLVGLLRPDRRLQVERFTDSCPVEVDPGQMEQVITNLVVNARHATPPNGAPIQIAARAEPQSGECVLEVTDRGSGIAPDDLKRIFDPFFTTRDEGTGLGLSVCHGVVKRCGGRIEVESEEGEGSRFRVVLPRAEDPAETGERPAPETGEAERTILVVDDQQPVLSMMQRSLTRAGFQVLTAGSAQEALDAARGVELVAVVSDVMMPGGSGPELVERLRTERPALPALFVTGYAPQADLLRRQDQRTRLLNKPFGPDELVLTVSQLLQAAQSARV